MATERRRNLSNSIDIQPWSSFKSTDARDGNSPYLVKYFFNSADYSYKVLLYDGIQLWSEHVAEKEAFEEKCKVRFLLFFFFLQ